MKITLYKDATTSIDLGCIIENLNSTRLEVSKRT